MPASDVPKRVTSRPLRRLVQTSVGPLELEFEAESSILVTTFDAAGWKDRVECGFASVEGALEFVGVPQDEARSIATQVRSERDDVPDATEEEGWPLLVVGPLVLLFTVGIWLAGALYLVRLVLGWF